MGGGGGGGGGGGEGVPTLKGNHVAIGFLRNAGMVPSREAIGPFGTLIPILCLENAI